MEGSEVVPQGEHLQALINEQITAAMMNMPGSDEFKMSTQDKRRARFMQTIKAAYEFIYVESADAVYYADKSNINGESYKKLNDVRGKQLVVVIFKKLYPNLILTDKQVIEYRDMIKNYVASSRPDVNDNLIKVGTTMYWDVEKGELTDIANSPCMRELFDADYIDDIKIDINEIHEPTLRSMYRKTIAHLEANNGIIKPYSLMTPSEKEKKGDPVIDIDEANGSFFLTPFWTWADYNIDTFNDLLKACASIFMNKKPNGAFILIGRTRNGKSSFIKMLHTMLGSNNTAAVRLADLDDASHFTYNLKTALMNAPDEDDEGKGKELLKSQSYFKSISAHSPIAVRTLYSDKPTKISTRFMSFYPMNKLPEWEGRGKEACMKRSLILMFNNDLSRFDNSHKDFEKDTYTSNWFTFVLGVFFGIAYYYRDRQMNFSETMALNKADISEEIDSATTYMNLAKKYFDGYQVGTILDDYLLWCKENGDLKYNRKDLKQKLSMDTHSIPPGEAKKGNLYIEATGEIRNFNFFRRRPDEGYERKKNALLDECYIPELDTYVSHIHIPGSHPGASDEPHSVVTLLEEYYKNHKDAPEQLKIEDGDIDDDGRLVFDGE